MALISNTVRGDLLLQRARRSALLAVALLLPAGFLVEILHARFARGTGNMWLVKVACQCGDFSSASAR